MIEAFKLDIEHCLMEQIGKGRREREGGERESLRYPLFTIQVVYVLCRVSLHVQKQGAE